MDHDDDDVIKLRLSFASEDIEKDIIQDVIEEEKVMAWWDENLDSTLVIPTCDFFMVLNYFSGKYSLSFTEDKTEPLIYAFNVLISYHSTINSALIIEQTLTQGGRVLLLTPDSDIPQELTLQQEV